jgi:hypothetical protein
MKKGAFKFEIQLSELFLTSHELVASVYNFVKMDYTAAPSFETDKNI